MSKMIKEKQKNIFKYNLNKKGVHYIDSFMKCSIKKNILNNPYYFKKKIDSKISEVGLHVVGYTCKKFNIGFTAVWLLEESHISIHTWPELSVVDIDIYVCNYINDNSNKARLIYSFFKKLFKSKKNKLIKIIR